MLLGRFRALGLSNRVSKAPTLKSLTKAAELTISAGRLPLALKTGSRGSPLSEGSSLKGSAELAAAQAFNDHNEKGKTLI